MRSRVLPKRVTGVSTKSPVYHVKGQQSFLQYSSMPAVLNLWSMDHICLVFQKPGLLFSFLRR